MARSPGTAWEASRLSLQGTLTGSALGWEQAGLARGERPGGPAPRDLAVARGPRMKQGPSHPRQ